MLCFMAPKTSPWKGLIPYPVEVAGQAPGMEERPLTEHGPAGRPAVVGIDDQLEPGQPGQTHLGAQAQQVIFLDILDPPPFQGISDGQVERVAATTAQSRPAEEAVEQTTGPPSETP
jgi:hypothetical protein